MSHFSPTDIITDPLLRHTLDVTIALEQQCDQLAETLDKLDSSTAAADQADLCREVFHQQKGIHARLAELRGLNRQAVMFARETKQQTANVRQDVDALHLELQNLYYQQRHLRGEIQACEEFPHTYTSLPIVPLEEYLETHPEMKGADPHELMTARIQHEREERHHLEKQRQELARQKKTLLAENLRRRQNLTNIDRDLTKFIDAATPILKTFEKDN